MESRNNMGVPEFRYTQLKYFRNVTRMMQSRTYSWIPKFRNFPNFFLVMESRNNMGVPKFRDLPFGNTFPKFFFFWKYDKTEFEVIFTIFLDNGNNVCPTMFFNIFGIRYHTNLHSVQTKSFYCLTVVFNEIKKYMFQLGQHSKCVQVLVISFFWFHAIRDSLKY